MVLRREERLVCRADMAELRAQWLTPTTSFKAESVVAAALVPYGVAAPAVNAGIWVVYLSSGR